MNRPLASFALTLGLAALAQAQITTTGPFTGTYTEEFETQSYTPCVPGRVFHNHGDLCTPGYSGCFITYGWLLYVGYAVYPHNSSNSFLGTTLGIANLTLDVPAQRFGGYFATVGYLAGGIARFYDANNQLLATLPVTAPRGAPWAWNGWDAGTGPKIKHIEVVANDPYNGGSLICMDDLEYDPAVALNFYGTACQGQDGPPDFRVSGTVGLGNTLTFRVTNTSAQSQLLFCGFDATTWNGFALPFDLGLINSPGCTVLTALDVQVAGGAVAPVNVTIPNQPNLLGATTYWQALMLGDPNQVAVVTTRAAAITLF